MNHADIIIEHKDGRRTKMQNVANFDDYVVMIRDLIRINDISKGNISIEELIRIGEGENIEFKETLRYDIRKGESSKEIEKSVLKSIAGFLNADGGTLLVGVNDDGVPVGLENDIKTLPKKNRDGLENYLTMLVKSMIGVNHTKHINVQFDKVSEREICAIHVRPGRKPAYLKNHSDNKEEFFVRVGNSTQPFSMSQAEEYIRNRFQ
jgi:predicted HTH transcriptional regulator